MRLLSCLAVLLTLLLSSSQLNETYFQQVVPMTAFSLSQLQDYTKQYLKSEEYTSVDDAILVANADSTMFQYPQQFMLYNRSVLKHPLGLVSYQATIDLKEEKFRYSADSVYVQNYIRNRYSRYVADNKAPRPFSEWKTRWAKKQQARLEEQIHEGIEAHLQQVVDALQQQKADQANTTRLKEG